MEALDKLTRRFVAEELVMNLCRQFDRHEGIAGALAALLERPELIGPYSEGKWREAFSAFIRDAEEFPGDLHIGDYTGGPEDVEGFLQSMVLQLSAQEHNRFCVLSARLRHRFDRMGDRITRTGDGVIRRYAVENRRLMLLYGASVIGRRPYLEPRTLRLCSRLVMEAALLPYRLGGDILITPQQEKAVSAPGGDGGPDRLCRQICGGDWCARDVVTIFVEHCLLTGPVPLAKPDTTGAELTALWGEIK